MAVRALHPILIALALLAGAAAARGLDQRLIHGYYKDGDFDRVIKSLTDYGKGCQCSRADSVFAEKHLAVVYAANPSTRELGRYHMFLMLDLAPNSDLLDMFVGEEVDAVFEKVRKENSLRAVAQKPAGRKAPALAVRPAPPRPIAARPAPRIGSESAPSGATNPSGAVPPRPAPNPFAKSARTLLEGKSPAPVRVAGTQPQGVYAAPAPVVAPIRARAFPLSAYVPKPSLAVAANPKSAVLSNIPPASQATVKSPRPASLHVPSKQSSALAGDKKPVWKEPGLWIGGGAALAVVAFTLFTAGEDEKSAASKTYVVPATASK